MKLIHFFYKYNKRFSITIVLLTVITGLLSGAVIAFVNTMMEQLHSPNTDFDFKYPLYFGALVLSYLLLSRYVSAAVTKFAIKMVHDLRMQIIKKLKSIEYRSFEKIGDEKIYTILINDSSEISNGSFSYAMFFSSIITIVFCLGYMLWLFPLGFLMIVLVIACGFSIYLVKQKAIFKDLEKARLLENVFFKQIEDLVKGFKEIKLSKNKQNDLYKNYIYKTSLETKELSAKSLVSYLDNSIFGQGFFYLFIGLVLFYFPVLLKDQNSTISTFLLLTLYILSPISVIANMVPMISRVKIAINQIEKLEMDIMSVKNEESHTGTDDADNQLTFTTIEFVVLFSYENDDLNDSFVLGPINITIKKGESHLIFGENGAGKSTFIKILTGLYKPTSGTILIDGEKLNLESYTKYRDLFSVVYSDYYLFENIYGLKKVEDSKVEALLNTMKIGGKVSYENNKFSTINLSSGQRKRLALIIGLIENKPILVLDEWAAEQDPIFKKIFYREIIPELENQGITVILISHDDQYYDCAKKIFLVNNGKIEKLASPKLMDSLN
jgi:cyclic peptide transporter